MSGRKRDNFRRALANLRQIRAYAPPYDAVTEAGLVALYEVCMEQAWKAMKETLEEQGFSGAETGSPRKVVKLAYSTGMISDEKAWIDALNARNLVTHTYDESVALGLIERARNEFLPLFEQLEVELDANWQLG